MSGSSAKGADKAPTLYDVAEVAGVSHQTVSRVVKGQTNIRADLRQRIEAAIKQLGYRPNLSARSLATNRSHRIGALVYEFLEIGPSRFTKGASDEAREAGYLLDIVSLDPLDEHAVEGSIALINPNDLAGLMVFAPSDAVLATLDKVGFTVPVYVESGGKAADENLAVAPDIAATKLTIEHLLALGHRRFFHIAGPEGWITARGRIDAYEESLASAGAVSVATAAGDWTARSGYEAGMSLPLDRGITAVVAGNDQMALGVMAALADRGVRIPAEMSVVGLDDIAEARYFRPALTTVRLDFERQGRAAMKRLLALIEGVDAPFGSAPDPELLVRSSTGPVPG